MSVKCKFLVSFSDNWLSAFFSKFGALFMSPVSLVFHTIVMLDSNVRLISKMLHYLPKINLHTY